MSRRYARIAEAATIGPAGLATWQKVKVAVLGLGNLGGHLAPHLVLMGVHTVLLDRDVVEDENLGNQGFMNEDLGIPKVQARARLLAKLNPDCRIEGVHVDIAHLGLGRLRDLDLIFCCLDSRHARTVVNEMAMRLRIPWVDAALDGTGRALFGRVAAYDPGQADSPCYLCPYDRAALGEIAEEQGTGCRVWAPAREPSGTAPTLATSALGAAVAAIQLIWGQKILFDRAAEVVGQELYLDLERKLMTQHKIRRNAACVMDHDLVLRPFQEADRASTVGQAFAAAEAQLGGEVSLELHRNALVTELRCPRCALVRSPYCTVQSIPKEEATCTCGAFMQPVATSLVECFGREEAVPFLDRTWAEIGLPPEDIITVRTGTKAIEWLLA